MDKINCFTKENYLRYCDQLASMEKRIEDLIGSYGYPPMWQRSSTFDGLVRIVLEQQVSLASAMAVFKKLNTAIGVITPEKMMGLDDDIFQSCGFSRQKKKYVKNIANEIVDNNLNFEELSLLPDEVVRKQLISIAGIGNWTCDIYLLMNLNRLDIFPIGDLAVVKAMKETGLVPETGSREDIEKTAKKFKPYRSILAMLMWHAYVKKRKMRV